jgi:DNA-binding MarR family transcriptional regulator
MSEKFNHKLLRMWRLSTLESVRSNEPDLTMRQMSVLLEVYMTEPPHTVRGLAANLNVTKPVITRALDTMTKYGFIKRKPDEKDKRSIFVQRTVKGAVYLSELSDRIVASEKIIDAEDQEADSTE